MIPKKTVQDILDAARIEDVVGEVVQLKRRGSNLTGLCPFHNEKTPSFSVSPAKNIFKCFGCGEAGDPLSFVMKHENMTYPEALRHLAGKYKIQVEEEELTPEVKQANLERDGLYIVNDYALKYYQDQLFNSDYGRSIGLGYFKDRGFREDIIRKFGLGFSPESGDALTKSATSQGYKLEILQKAGLTGQSGRDFFRNRVMFTIHNLSGKVVGFAGRIMTNDKKQPKYINTPESEIYNKSKTLFGLNFAKSSISKLDECLMVEGYTDVISLHQSGIENVVASSGTSLTEGQIALVKRFTKNITILYDGDAAGIKAALRGLDLVLEQDMNVRVVLLPDGEDPDSYIRKVGTEDCRTFIQEKAVDFILFKTQLLLSEAQGDPVKRANLIKDIVASISKIPDAIKRSVFVKECARLMDISEQLLVTESNKMVADHLKKLSNQNTQGRAPSDMPPLPEFGPDGEIYVQSTPEPPLKTKSDDAFQEKDLVRILIEFGERKLDEHSTVARYILGEIDELLEGFDNERYAKIVKIYIDTLQDVRHPNTSFWTSYDDDEVADIAINMLIDNYVYSRNWEKLDVFTRMPDENYIKDTLSSLERFKLVKLQAWAVRIKKELENWQSLSSEELNEKLKIKTKIDAFRIELSKKYGTTIVFDSN